MKSTVVKTYDEKNETKEKFKPFVSGVQNIEKGALNIESSKEVTPNDGTHTLNLKNTRQVTASSSQGRRGVQGT